MDAYENLANAIILQAVDDWRRAAKTLKLNRKEASARVMLEDCEEFFQSDWFGELTDLDGGYLLRKLREEVRK